jgi:plasmid stability protein
MKSITVHGVSEEAAELLRQRAKNEGRSVNKVMKELIDQSLGLGSGKTDNRAAFMEFCGVWTEEEAKAFLDAVADLEQVDEADWR